MARNSALLLAIFGLFIAGTSGFEDIVAQWPKDEALREGETGGRLNCNLKSGASFSFLTWQTWRVGDTGQKQIYTGTQSGGGKVVADETDNYESDPAKYHDLVIKAAQMKHAGNYLCTVTDTNGEADSKQVTLTVAEKAQCSSGGTDDKEVGHYVDLDCSVRYLTGLVKPFLPDIKWYDEGDNEIAGGSYIDTDIPEEGKSTLPPTHPKTRLYRVNRTATGEDDDKTFKCRVSFDQTNYEDFCETKYSVLFAASGITFQPDYADGDTPLKLRVGDHINCTAQGNPDPTYTWMKITLDGGGEQIVEDSQLVMTEDMVGSTNEYECTAKNTIKGQPYEPKLNVKFDVTPVVGSGSFNTFSLAVLLTSAVAAIFKQF